MDEISLITIDDGKNNLELIFDTNSKYLYLKHLSSEYFGLSKTETKVPLTDVIGVEDIQCSVIFINGILNRDELFMNSSVEGVLESFSELNQFVTNFKDDFKGTISTLEIDLRRERFLEALM